MRQRITRSMFSVAGALVFATFLTAMGVGILVPVARAQATASAEAKAKVTLSTQPSPAQKGSDTVRVKLTDEAGKPISGADVAVTFSMAAMPSMNMPAMKTPFKMTDNGDGTYEGKGDLESKGTWQVTVTAKQNGQTIATRKLAVKAVEK